MLDCHICHVMYNWYVNKSINNMLNGHFIVYIVCVQFKQLQPPQILTISDYNCQARTSRPRSSDSSALMRNLGRPASGINLASHRQTHCAAVNKERASLYTTARQSCSGTCCSSAIGLLPRQSRQASSIQRHSLVVWPCHSNRRASHWLSSEKLPVQRRGRSFLFTRRV